MYDAATAAVEAGFMCLNAKRKQKTVLVAETVHPEIRQVMKTYFEQSAQTLVEVGMKDGLLDLTDLEAKLTPDVAGIICQYPNFFGNIEDMKTVAEKVHANGSLMVINADPIALGLLESPAQLGADIVVGDGQGLGNALNFGGPSLGFMAAKEAFIRFIPGRVVGQTTDAEGNRGFVLTLQAREQHIRREKALSNICSNQALNALAALIYLTVMGKKGLRQVATDSFKRAHYLMERINQVPRFKIKFAAPFFKEFVVETEHDVDCVLKALLDAKILGGYALGKDYAELANCFMVAVKAEIDQFVQVLEGVK
jgi:glycine dehydrogenase subunit 1